MFQANDFDVLIVDHQMPEKDGIEVLHGGVGCLIAHHYGDEQWR